MHTKHSQTFRANNTDFFLFFLSVCCSSFRCNLASVSEGVSGGSMLTVTFSSYLFCTSGKWGCWWGFQQQEDIQKGNKNINENSRKPRKKNVCFVVFEKALSVFCKISSQVTDPLSRKQTLPLVSALEGSVFGVVFMCDSVKLNLGGIGFLEVEGIKCTQRIIVIVKLPNPVLRVGSRSSDWLGSQARPRVFSHSGLVPRRSRREKGTLDSLSWDWKGWRSPP